MKELAGKKVYIVEPIDGCESIYSMFTDLGCQLDVGPYVSRPRSEGFTEDQLCQFAKEYDGIIGMSREKITRRVLESATRLCTVAKFGIGVDHIDLQAATECSIIVTNTPVHNMTVAEHTIALMLAVLKKMVRNDAYLRAGNWRHSSTMGYELYHKKIGLVGIGGIGKQVIKRLAGWDVEILAYDPYVSPETAQQLGVKLVDWNTLFSEADVVSLHTPLTPQTKGFIGTREFEMMKKSAILVNASRGPVVNQSALIDALQNGEIWGAGLDVFETEPVPTTNPLVAMTENVVVSPHNAGWTVEALQRMADQAAINTIKAIKGEMPDFVVNKAVIPTWEKRFK